MDNKVKLQTIIWLIVVIIGVVFVSASSNSAVNASSGTGFWLGLLHGTSVPISFIISLVLDNVHFYEVNNNGNWYNFGFVLGLLILFGTVDNQFGEMNRETKDRN